MTLLLLNYHVTNDEGVSTSGTTSGKGSRLVLTRRWCSANNVICCISDRRADVSAEFLLRKALRPSLTAAVTCA